MTKPKSKVLPKSEDQQPATLAPNEKPELQKEWDREAQRTINESALRKRPEWIEAIGDEDENPTLVEEDLREYGFELRGEDDYVSDPTNEADSPGWVDDDYDDEFQDKLEEREEETADDADRDDRRFYSD